MADKMTENTALKALQLILAAIVFAAGINLLHPKRIPWIGDWAHHVETQAVAEGVALMQLLEMIEILRDGGRLIVDARPADEYRHGHIPGAISVPFEAVVQGVSVPDRLIHSLQPIVFYCSGQECEDSLLLALKVREAGQDRVAVFTGGMALWESELLAVEEDDE